MMALLLFDITDTGLIFGQFYSCFGVIFPMPKSIFFPNFWRKIPNFKSEKNLKKNHHFYHGKSWLKLLNIQHCTFSYNTSCNSDYKLALQLKFRLTYDVFYDLTI